ncbi:MULTISPECIES: SMP-30/gluconolactonase/LRE family protein [Nocardia]|uniref:SMP-30/gluconolactonase/LRE family protein n=1 Tax=Nocardia TaxID=1817 RepID=UPI001894FDB9|nr:MULTISPECIES: SMP-30/gluconolactonase/LRE family protein [Nocardia]MBF6352563.1 SMP-30/gluconolactonase/LRE family protein [Nocardia flavorosea]
MLETKLQRWSAPLIAVVAGLALTGCGSTAPPTPPTGIETAFELPGDRVYPEGIALDERTGDIYVGSFADGTIYRAAPGAPRAEVFLPAGSDGRRTANGLRVDPDGRLWIIDSTTGVTVYDLTTRALLARLDAVGPADRFLNDIALTPDGTAYLTDSRRAVVYRVTPDALTRAIAAGGHGELTDSVDLNPSLEPHDPGAYTLNGIAADPTGSYLLTVDSTGGDLYRIDLTTPTAAVSKVTLDGGDLHLGDGLDLHDGTLRVAHNTDDTLSAWTVSPDGSSATRTTGYHDEALDTPTTLVHHSGHTLVVASQFDKGGPLGPGSPTIAFRVLEISGI